MASTAASSTAWLPSAGRRRQSVWLEGVPRVHPAIRVHETIAPLENPILVVGIASRGMLSASVTVGHLAAEWNARFIAEIDPDNYYDFNVLRPHVRLEDGVRLLEWPESRFFVARPEGASRDVVLFTAIEPHYHWRDFVGAVGALAAQLGVQESLFVTVRPGATPHTRPIPIHLRDADEATAARFGVPLTSSSYQGPTSITTVMALDHRERGWGGGVLSAVRPFYIGVEPSPHAVAAVADVIAEGLGSTVGTHALQKAASEIDGQLAAAMGQSEDLATFIGELERQYDAARLSGDHAALSSNGTRQLETGGLMAEIDRFLREQQDATGRGEAPRTL